MDEPEMVQVVMTSRECRLYEEWLAEHGLHLFFIPSESESDLPTYGVGHNG